MKEIQFLHNIKEEESIQEYPAVVQWHLPLEAAMSFLSRFVPNS